MGYAQIVPDVTFPQDVPRIPVLDPSESSGSLLLIDPTHPANPWPTGLLTSRTPIPNIHKDNAELLAGAVSAPVFQRTIQQTNGGLAERTEKGGVHFRVSANQDVAGYVRISIPLAIQQYMLANRTHVYYLSLWIRSTDKRTDNASTQLAVFPVIIQSQSVYGTRLGTNATPDNNQGYTTAPVGRSSGLQRLSAAVVLPDLGSAPLYRARVQMGTDLMINTADWPYAPGLVFYRFSIEDLTVSGRTYEQAEAIDQALMSETFAPGGRYNADSWWKPGS